jgi:hypothetical protein
MARMTKRGWVAPLGNSQIHRISIKTGRIFPPISRQPDDSSALTVFLFDPMNSYFGKGKKLSRVITFAHNGYKVETH